MYFFIVILIRNQNKKILFIIASEIKDNNAKLSVFTKMTYRFKTIPRRVFLYGRKQQADSKLLWKLNESRLTK